MSKAEVETSGEYFDIRRSLFDILRFKTQLRNDCEVRRAKRFEFNENPKVLKVLSVDNLLIMDQERAWISHRIADWFANSEFSCGKVRLP